MRLTLQRVADATGGRILHGDPELELHAVVTDSRGAIPASSLFVALRGAHFDGHDFLDEAIRNGATAVLIATPEPGEAEGAVLVPDTREALQRLAADWRASFAGPVVGITGSNGKTIVKEMLASILGRAHTTYRSPGSYNSQIGVPLALLGLRPEHEIAVIEAGISQVGEMQRLEAMIRPDVGIVTNIGPAHAAGLGDLETTAREKLQLLQSISGTGFAVLPADDPTLAPVGLPCRTVRFGGAKTADYRVSDIASRDAGFTFEVHFPDGASHAMRLRVPGAHNVANAAAAIATAAELGVDVEAIRAGLAAFELSPMRMELITTQSGITLLNDAYSSDPISARAALNALVQYASGHRTVAILGDMLDLGASAAPSHRELGELVARLDVDHLVCVGPLAALIGEAAAAQGMPLSRIWGTGHGSREEDLEHLLDQLLEPGDYVLFKGSRAMGLERAAQSLVESVAPERLYIDLDAIRENYQAIRRRIGPDIKIMAVVKSFGYGNDATRISQTLVQQGVDALAVAYPDEAIPLRRRGIDVPILVTNVLPGEADKIVKYRLTPLLHSERVAQALEAQAARHGIALHVHIEVDTGMNRLGFRPDEVVDFLERFDAFEHLIFEGIMMHFAAADMPQEDAFSRAQIARFDQVVSDVRAAGFSPTLVHAANTAAAWRFPEARYDMIRLGLGLYGLHPSEHVGAETGGSTRPALRFATQVVQVKTLEAGETVGYGRTWRAPDTRRIATIAIGYNDGFPRFMSNGGEVLVRGQRCPVVGAVCMDATMIDVTHLDEVEVGDEVVLFGEQDGARISVEEIAARGHTINYEILTNISPRVRRIFLRS